MKKLLTDRGEDIAPQSVDRVEDIVIPGPAGDIEARVYAPSSTGPLPIVVYWHGGGWVFADLDTYDSTPRALAAKTGCIVVSCHYRQAPEHPFPAPVEDAYAAYQWVCQHAAELGGDPARIAVAGESAGGNLATVVSMKAKDEGGQPPLMQLLVYPVTDNAFASPSILEVTDPGVPLNRSGMEWFWEHYLGQAADGANPHASPLRASNLAGLPPAVVILAEIDPLRSEGEQYAARLREAGVPVELKVYTGVVHEFFGMPDVVDEARDAIGVASAALMQAFGTSMPAPPSVTAGMEVVTQDGETVGNVKTVRSGDFLVDRSMKRDIYVPLGSVEQANGQVRLHARSAEIGDLDWTQPLPV